MSILSPRCHTGKSVMSVNSNSLLTILVTPCVRIVVVITNLFLEVTMTGNTDHIKALNDEIQQSLAYDKYKERLERIATRILAALYTDPPASEDTLINEAISVAESLIAAIDKRSPR
jgi:hypothetical protein